MRILTVLFLLACVSCRHVPSSSKGDRCSDVSSPRDAAFAAREQQALFLRASKEVEGLSKALMLKLMDGLNVRNRSGRPLTDEQTLQAQGRFLGIRNVLEAERDHLTSLAGAVVGSGADPDALSRSLASEPRLTRIQEDCRAAERKTRAELESSRSIVQGELLEFNVIVSDYALGDPVGIVLSP